MTTAGPFARLDVEPIQIRDRVLAALGVRLVDDETEPTDRQTRVLNDRHVTVLGMSRRDASAVISALFDREADTRASFRQLARLIDLGYTGSELLSLNQWKARDIVDRRRAKR